MSGVGAYRYTIDLLVSTNRYTIDLLVSTFWLGTKRSAVQEKMAFHT